MPLQNQRIMQNILDDFKEDLGRKQRTFYWVVYTILIIGVLVGASYLQSRDILQSTPALETPSGQCITCFLFIATIYCFRVTVKSSWFISMIMGSLLLVICFTFALQLVVSIVGRTSSIVLTWFFISVCYTFLSTMTMKIVAQKWNR